MQYYNVYFCMAIYWTQDHWPTTVTKRRSKTKILAGQPLLLHSNLLKLRPCLHVCISCVRPACNITMKLFECYCKLCNCASVN